MIIKGKYNEAVVFTDSLDETSRLQIEKMLDSHVFAKRKIRIMPDVHAGVGCVIGLSMDMGETIVPNLVGVDIGCGVLTMRLKERTLDLSELDRVIKQYVPSGFAVHRSPSRKHKDIAQAVGVERVVAQANIDRALRSIGTLGGGNHFIEIGRSSGGKLYLFVHTGSRHFGYEIAQFHQRLAVKRHPELSKGEKDLAYLDRVDAENYLHDMKIAQNYAAENRLAIAETVLEKMDLTVLDAFDTVHNFIDQIDRIIRKGAVPARKNAPLVIPLNMKDGVIICKGKGNKEWNETAPHGAGRLYSRSEARRRFTLEDFKQSMENVHSTSVSNKTIDEAPMAYKDARSITRHIEDTVDIVEIVKPIYNFKGQA